MTRPLVLVLVGTDHHRFDRLIDWTDAWIEARSGAPVDCLVQFGTSKSPRHARATSYLPHEELQGLMADARAVVSHGGPSTIAETRRHGIRPIVVPRAAELGEHVDNHQQRFCRWMAGKALIDVIETVEELQARLEERLATRGTAVTADRTSTQSTARLFGDLIDETLRRHASLLAGQRPPARSAP